MVGEIRAKHRIPKKLVRSVVIVIAICAIVLGITDILHPTNSALNEINHFPQATLISVAQQMVSGNISNALFSMASINNTQPLFSNGKLEIFYLGASSCQYCARTRIPLAIALAQFGFFSQLYQEYSLGDGNYPTIAWGKNIVDGVDIGNTYNSNLIDFISTDAYQPNGFGGVSVSQTELASPSTTPFFNIASRFFNLSSGYYGTPFLFIGDKLVNSAPTYMEPVDVNQYYSTLGSNVIGPYMTPSQLVNMIYNDNGAYANVEIQAADLYIATICNSLKGQNVSNTICSNPVFGQLYNLVG